MRRRLACLRRTLALLFAAGLPAALAPCGPTAAAPLHSAAADAGTLEVDMELILAVDISRSMDIEELRLQRDGYVRALRDPDVIAAARGGLVGRIAVLYFEWAGPNSRNVIGGWTLIEDASGAETLAAALEAGPIRAAVGTSISGALDWAAGEFDRNAYEGLRRVIDISGDGANNHGELVVPARDRAVRRGVTINGLPIVNGRPSPYGTPQIPNLDWYFEDCVIGGPGAFIVVADGFADFGRAIKRKLIREIAGLSGPRIESADVDFPRLAMAREGRAGSVFGRVRAVRMEQRPSCEAGEDMLKNMDDT